jgi:hypothetical protein
MFNKAKPARDPFAFSLGGMAAITSFAIAPVVADDQINKVWDERFRRDQSGTNTQRNAAQPHVHWVT